ncbi:MAG: CRISPR-associated protein Cas5 [Clostridia bacterium]|nr:CRISPR-associated protein Cas5 [Clostridia bacterium]
MDRVVVFDLTGPMAHFRKYYTNTSALTYGFPPRTVLMGIVAAVLGWERDTYYERLDAGRYAVAIKVPGRRLVQTVNYLRTKKEDLSELRRLGRVPGTQTPLEFLLPAGQHPALRFRVFFTHPDGELLAEVARRLREGRSFYPLYLGLTECPASALFVAQVEAHAYEVLPPSGAVALTTVLNAALLQDVVLGGTVAPRRLVRERVPQSFGPGRTLKPPASVIYEAGGQPFAVRLRVPAYRFRLRVGGSAPAEETVAFLEG